MSLKKTALAGLSLFAMMLALMLGLAAPATAAPGCEGGYPPKPCGIQLSANVVQPGQRLGFSAQGFGSHERVVAYVVPKIGRSGSFHSNRKGDVDGKVRIPRHARQGQYSLVLVGKRTGVVLGAGFTVARAGGHGHGGGPGNGNGNGNGGAAGGGNNGGNAGGGGSATAHNAASGLPGTSGANNGGAAAGANAAGPNAAGPNAAGPNAAGPNAAGVNAAAQTNTGSQLAFTGAEIAGFAGAGVVLIGGGVLLVLLARRRRGNGALGA